MLAHLLLLMLVLLPARDSGIDYGHREGAGGSGPTGGGGGGLGDEAAPRLNFVQIAPQAVTAPLAKTPAVTRTPQPVLPPIPKPVPTVAPPPPPSASAAPQQQQPTPASGTGGAGTGTGKTGTSGAGQGTGGGVGSGEGTGTGSGVGPGTGGGDATNHPPTLKQFVLPPLPTPASVRGFKLTAWFDVDSTGRATLLRFTPTPDRGYNDRIRETLLALRFRPAVRPDGSAIRDTVDIEVLF